MPLKRQLSDLYVIGKDVTISDGSGDDVTVYLKKLSPVDLKTAARKANAARAHWVAAKRDKESDEYVTIRAQAIELGDHDTLIEFIVSSELNDVRAAKEAELEAEDEWANDGYLQSLYDAWTDGGMEERFFDESEDVEAKRVFDELNRFNDTVNSFVEPERKNLQKVWAKRTYEAALDKVTGTLMDFQSDSAWLDEFRMCEIWLSVRESSDSPNRYFDKREEVDALQSQVISTLLIAYSELGVEAEQGKD